MNNKGVYIIAIDGPAGSGKGTVAKEISKKLNYNYLDSGAIYRIIALACLKKNIDYKQNHFLEDLIINTKISFEKEIAFLNDKDVSKEIRDERVSKIASYIAQNSNQIPKNMFSEPFQNVVTCFLQCLSFSRFLYLPRYLFTGSPITLLKSTAPAKKLSISSEIALNILFSTVKI